MSKDLSRRKFMIASTTVSLTGCLHTNAERKPEIAGNNSNDINNPIEKWSFSTEESVISPPISVGSIVFISDMSGRMYALEGESSELINWRQPNYNIQNNVLPPVEGVDEISEKWVFETGSMIYSRPVVYDEKLFFGSTDGMFYCLNVEDGSEIWSYDTGGVAGSGLCVDEDGYVYCLSADSYDGYTSSNVYGPGLLHKIDGETGELMWEFETSEAITCSPKLFNGSLFFSDNGGVFYRVNSETGEVEWKTSVTNGVCDSSPGISTSHNLAIFGCENNSAHAVNIETGEVEWEIETTGAVNSDPVVVGNRVFIASYEGKVHEVNLDSGSKVNVYDVGEKIFAPPIYKNNTLFILTTGSSSGITVIDTNNGKKIWEKEFMGRSIMNGWVLCNKSLYVSAGGPGIINYDVSRLV